MMMNYKLATEINGRDSGATYPRTLQAALDEMSKAEESGVEGLIIYLYVHGKISPRRNTQGQTFRDYTHSKGEGYTEDSYVDWLTGCEL